MNRLLKVRGSLRGVLGVAGALLTLSALLVTDASAKVYIDITSPAFKRLPIGISDLAGPKGQEIAEILRDDLDFTGLFMCLDNKAFVETPSQPFNPSNWSVIGAEAVVKGTVQGDKNLSAAVTLYDVMEGKEIFRKEYQTEASLVRPLAHTIANDIYKQLTGENGIFRTRIAFVTRRGGEDNLSLMDWDGFRMNSFGVKGSVILSPHWSRDGAKLLYSAERNRQWNLYLLNFSRMVEAKIYSAKGTNIAGDFFPDGDEFVFSSSSSGSPDLYAYAISSSKLTRLTSSRGIDVSPALSPDGSRVVFVSDRDGSPQLFVMTRNGADVRRITFSGSYNTSPSWSPKGDKIAFSGRQGGKNQIFLVNSDGSSLLQLTDTGNNEDPSFSPDGRYIVFTSDRDGEKAVYIMRANGEAQKKITPRGLKAFGPRWSPN